MTGFLFTLLLLAAVATWLLRGRFSFGGGGAASSPAGAHVFRIAFRAGRAGKIEGRIPRTMLAAFEDIAAQADTTGEIRLDAEGDLHFSETIPPGERQQFRNAYVTSLNVH